MVALLAQVLGPSEALIRVVPGGETVAVAIGSKKSGAPRHGKPRKRKLPGMSLHGHGVAVSVDERVEDLVRRYPALGPSLGALFSDNRKRIRDFPSSEQERILRMVFALKKASSGS